MKKITHYAVPGVVLLGCLLMSVSAYNGPVPQPQLAETANKANRIYNNTRKDDCSKNPNKAEKEGDDFYSVPRNNLYVVADPTDEKFKVSLQWAPDVSDRSNYICAAYEIGTTTITKVFGTDTKFPSTAGLDANIQIPAPTAASTTAYEIRAGYDQNHNDLLDSGEEERILIYRKTRNSVGAPVSEDRYATVMGISTQKYQDGVTGISGWVNSIAIPFLVPVPHAFLSRFYNMNWSSGTSNCTPNGSPPITFDAFQNATAINSNFSEWLTHNSGARFNEAGIATDMQKHVWDAHSWVSDWFLNRDPLALNATRIIWIPTLPPVGIPIEYRTDTGAALESYYNSNVKSVAEAQLGSQPDGSWYFSSFYSFPASSITILPSMSSSAYPTSTVVAGYEPAETSWPGTGAAALAFLATLAGDTPRLDNFAAYITLGRMRANIRFQFQVRREFNGFWTEYVVRKVWCSGSLTDLYDFTYEDEYTTSTDNSAARNAAMIQIGGGAGRGGIPMATPGRIFRVEINIDNEIADPFR